jgi:hypothetical protein
MIMKNQSGKKLAKRKQSNPGKLTAKNSDTFLMKKS